MRHSLRSVQVAHLFSTEGKLCSESCSIFAQLTPMQIHSLSSWKMEGISLRGAAEHAGW